MARPATKTQSKPQPRAIKNVPRRELYPTGEAEILLCCGPKFLKEEMDAGRIGYVIRGRYRLVTAYCIDEYVRSISIKATAQ